MPRLSLCPDCCWRRRALVKCGTRQRDRAPGSDVAVYAVSPAPISTMCPFACGFGMNSRQSATVPSSLNP